MKYRKFGKLNWEVSALGFGCMRLPVIGGESAKVDEAEASLMLRYAIDNGVNYVDTAFGYHGGNSERFVGKALKDGYRSKVKVATKLPATRVTSADDFDRIFDEQRQRLQTDKIDFYLLHGLDHRNWPKVKDLGVLKWAEDKITQGQIGHLGFSFHDEYDVFKEIIDAYDNWTLCQIQYNYIDIENQAGRKGVEYAARKGLAIVVMEPVRGGILSRTPPPAVADIWGDAAKKRSLAEWALQWVWNQPEISLALSGMTTMSQVVENLAAADRSKPGVLTGNETSLLEKVRQAYASLNPVACTACGYCMPCPNGVQIPRIFQMYNDAIVYNELRKPQMQYNGGPHGISEEQRADKCIECKNCEDACPQHLPIIESLKKAHLLLKK